MQWVVQVIRVSVLLFSVGLLGCSEPGESDSSLALHIRANSGLQGVTIRTVEQESSTVEGSQNAIRFTARGELSEDWYVAFDAPKAVLGAGYTVSDQSDLDDAIREVDEFAQPWRDEARVDIPKELRGRWYRRVAQAEDAVTMQGSVQSQLSDSGPVYRSPRWESVLIGGEQSAIPASRLPSNANLVVDGTSERDAALSIIQNRSDWMEQYNNAVIAMQDHWDETREGVIERTRQGHSWVGWLDIPARPAERVRLDVLHSAEEARVVYVTLTSAERDLPGNFILFEGSLGEHRDSDGESTATAAVQLTPSPIANIESGWAVEELFKRNPLTLRIQPEEPDTLLVSVRDQEVEFERDGSNAYSDRTLADVSESLRSALSPGSYWEGTLDPVGDDPSVSVGLVVSQNKNDGETIQLDLSLSEYPQRVRRYAGRIEFDTSAPFGWAVSVTSLANQPHTLETYSSFRRRAMNMRLRLSGDGKLFGFVRGEWLTLSQSGTSLTTEATTAGVRDAITPGSVWRGTTQQEGAPAVPIEIEFVSNQNSGNALVAVVRSELYESMISVYEGVSLGVDENADVWPIRATKEKTSFSLDGTTLFDRNAAGFTLRLTHDGGLTGWALRGNSERERLDLVKVDRPAGAMPTDILERRQVILDRLSPGGDWRGIVQTSEGDRRVSLKIQSLNHESGEVRFVVRDDTEPEVVQAEFSARLRTTNPEVYGWQFSEIVRQSNPEQPSLVNPLLGRRAARHVFLRMNQFGDVVGWVDGQEIKLVLD